MSRWSMFTDAGDKAVESALAGVNDAVSAAIALIGVSATHGEALDTEVRVKVADHIGVHDLDIAAEIISILERPN